MYIYIFYFDMYIYIYIFKSYYKKFYVLVNQMFPTCYTKQTYPTSVV